MSKTIKSVMSQTAWQKKTASWECGIKRLKRLNQPLTFVVYVHTNSMYSHKPSSYATYDSVEAIRIYRALLRILQVPLQALGGATYNV